jgi:hypothetical protein
VGANLVTMHDTWEKAHEMGHAKGRVETRAGDVLTVLRARGLAVPASARQRILAQKDLKRLDRWLKKAAVAESVREVIDDLS